MKFIINFDLKLSSLNNHNEETNAVKEIIQNLFDIENKIDFFSTSSEAYVLNAFDKRLTLELKK